MITPRLESGENLFEVLREKFNALAEAVDRLDKLASASPLLDVVDTGAGTARNRMTRARAPPRPSP